MKQSAVRQGCENRVSASATDVLGNAVSDAATVRVFLACRALYLSGTVFPLTVTLSSLGLIAIALVVIHVSARRRRRADT